MATNIDRWLKGLDNLTRLDRGEIDERLTALRAELKTVQLKVAILTELRNQAPETSKKASDQLPLERDEQPVATPPANGDRAHDWKRQAVLHLMRMQPDRVWKAADVRDSLIRAGVMVADEGTPTRLLLRRMHEA